jgi:hypothetical protein
MAVPFSSPFCRDVTIRWTRCATENQKQIRPFCDNDSLRSPKQKAHSKFIGWLCRDLSWTFDFPNLWALRMSRVAPQQDIPIGDAQPASRWFVPAEKLANGETSAKWQSKHLILWVKKANFFVLNLELTVVQKTGRVVSVVLKIIFLFAIIFTFICTLNLLTDAFKLIGVRGIGELFRVLLWSIDSNDFRSNNKNKFIDPESSFCFNFGYDVDAIASKWIYSSFNFGRHGCEWMWAFSTSAQKTLKINNAF